MRLNATVSGIPCDRQRDLGKQTQKPSQYNVVQISRDVLTVMLSCNDMNVHGGSAHRSSVRKHKLLRLIYFKDIIQPTVCNCSQHYHASCSWRLYRAPCGTCRLY